MEANDPISGESAAVYNPRLHIWNEHFMWSTDGVLIIGLTPTGRATVEKLHLNRIGVVNLRGLLHVFGKHPPSDAAD